MLKHLTLTSLALTMSLGACGTDPEPKTTTEQQRFEACEQEFTLQEPIADQAWTPLAVELVSEKLRDGVYVYYDKNAADYEPQGYPVATSGGFVIGDDGVLLVETMINRQLFCQVVELIQAETDKHVLYAVNTSAHGDHSYGNMFLPDDVKIVQHERTAAFIANYFEDDRAFMIANFGQQQGLEEIIPTSPDVPVSDAGWSVDLGGITVEAKYFGFGQTDGDLFVYLPAEKIMWAGNAVVANAPAIPWLLEGHAQEVKTTLTAVQAALDSDAIIVPGHGVPMTPAGITFTLDYLDTLITETQQAVSDGKTLEETVMAVSMDDYQGYALWGWVHAQINVPATYAELSQ